MYTIFMSRPEAREFPRFTALLPVRVETLGEHVVTLYERLIDISRRGARISCQARLAPGTAVAIYALDFMLLGEIVWCEEGTAGVELDQVLDLDALRALMEE